MDRRSNTVKGFVNFPVHDESWKSSYEGGMIVKLYVIPKYDATYDTDFEVCCGNTVTDMLGESFIGSDHYKLHHYEEECGTESNLTDILEKYFPRVEKYGDDNQYLSVPLYASIILGNTGWSGYNGEEYWHCTYYDLTEDGKTLYNSLKSLYGESAELHILTFLDT